MIKRILAVALAVMMVLAMATVGVSAADTTTESTGTSGYIYFNSAGWNNIQKVYCHLWIVGSDAFYGWQTGGEECEKVNGTLWKYDLSKLDASTYISGGLKAGTDYCVIFSSDTQLQTYDATLGTECIGDRLTMTGKQIENPVDSNKKGYEATWAKNASKYGPHFAISSVGNFLGSKLAPHETGTKVIGDWLIAYSGSQFCDPVKVLTEALPKLKVKDIDAVMAYIMTQDLGISSADTMQSQLEQAYKAAYGEEKKVDTKKVAEKKQTIEKNGGNTDAASDDVATPASGASGNGYSSGSGADGQEHTIFFVLAGIMALAAGAYFVTRKRTEV